MSLRRRVLVAFLASLFVVAVCGPIVLAIHIVDARDARSQLLAVQVANVKATKREVLHAICLGRQDNYDSQVAYTRDFLGPELRATAAQIAMALADQRRVLEARPRCGASASSTGTRGTVSP